MKLNSIPFLFALFGGALCVTGIINAAKLYYYDASSGYHNSWGMSADWYIAARKEGWLRDGRRSNLWSALIGTVLFALGMYFWNGSPISTRGQDFMLLVSGLALIIGVAGRGVEDGYSVSFKTMRWAGVVGAISALAMIFS